MAQVTSQPGPGSFPWRRTIIWMVGLAAGAYLLTRHAGHVAQFLPLLILLACPLMHLFHHRHHQH